MQVYEYEVHEDNPIENLAFTAHIVQNLQDLFYHSFDSYKKSLSQVRAIITPDQISSDIDGKV